LDVPLEEKSTIISLLKTLVSILVLLDVPLEVLSVALWMRNAEGVSILVLLDVPLEVRQILPVFA
jgi:hypothetical protein